VRRAAGLIVLALLVGGVAVSQALSPSTEHVLLVGDSIMRQTGRALANQLGEDYTVHNEGVNGSGLLTPNLFDWTSHLEEDLVRYDPDLVVFLFIGNYTDDPTQFWSTPEGQRIRSTGSAAFAREWGRKANQAMAMIEDSGADVLLVLPPPMPTGAKQAVADRLRAEYGRVAGDWPFVRLVDAADAVGGDGGQWVETLPDRSGRERPVRIADGVHLSPYGERLLARRITRAVRAD
jgi:hypothetical protein